MGQYFKQVSNWHTQEKGKDKRWTCASIKHHAIEVYWGMEVQLHTFVDLGTRWRWVVSFTPGRFTTRERTPGTHWTGGWVGPRIVLDAVVKRKIPSPCRESNPRTPIVQPVAVFGLSNTGIVGSDPNRGMDVSVFFCVVWSCVGAGFASGRSPAQGVLPTVQIHS
jgi:hypothetical protein